MKKSLWLGIHYLPDRGDRLKAHATDTIGLRFEVIRRGALNLNPVAIGEAYFSTASMGSNLMEFLSKYI